MKKKCRICKHNIRSNLCTTKLCGICCTDVYCEKHKLKFENKDDGCDFDMVHPDDKFIDHILNRLNNVFVVDIINIINDYVDDRPKCKECKVRCNIKRICSYCKTSMCEWCPRILDFRCDAWCTDYMTRFGKCEFCTDGTCRGSLGGEYCEECFQIVVDKCTICKYYDKDNCFKLDFKYDDVFRCVECYKYYCKPCGMFNVQYSTCHIDDCTRCRDYNCENIRAIRQCNTCRLKSLN